MINKNVSIYWCLLNINGMFFALGFFLTRRSLPGRRWAWAASLVRISSKATPEKQSLSTAIAILLYCLGFGGLLDKSLVKSIVRPSGFSRMGRVSMFQAFLWTGSGGTLTKESSADVQFIPGVQTVQISVHLTFISGDFWKISSLGTHLEVLRNWRQQLLRQRREFR